MLAARHITLDKGEFQIALPIPATATGRCHVRIYIQGQDDCALGATAVEVAGQRKTKGAGGETMGKVEGRTSKVETTHPARQD
ncbi:MAG: hypothetical protein GTO03_17085 [Planctomycetales bacterium]|nr:hypothetical protein [Planctomycetales bacterium]